MYHPSRGGVRGGRDQFNWEDVKGDKHRENYLGHSVKAPVGRWQKGKDLHWYTRDRNSEGDAAKDEIKRIQEEEEEAMQEMLGLAPRKARRQGNLLNEREVSELLKKGNDADESAPSRAAGERVEGLGFAPAPPQTEPGQALPKRVVREQQHAAPVISGTKMQELEGPKGEMSANGVSPVTKESAAAATCRTENESTSVSSEEEDASRRKRRRERRRAKEQRREEKRERRQARLQKTAKRSETGSQTDKNHKEKEESHGSRKHDVKNTDGFRGDTRQRLSHISDNTKIESFQEVRVSNNRRTRHDSGSSEGDEREAYRQLTNARTKLGRDDRSYSDEGKGTAGEDSRREGRDVMKWAGRKDSLNSDSSEQEKCRSTARDSRRVLRKEKGDNKDHRSLHHSVWKERNNDLQSRSLDYNERIGGKRRRQHDREGRMEDAGKCFRDANVSSKVRSTNEEIRKDKDRDDRERGSRQ